MKIVTNEEELGEVCVHCWHSGKSPDDILCTCCHCGLTVTYEFYHSKRMKHGPHRVGVLYAVERVERGQVSTQEVKKLA